mmetsp:Transcript_21828/g.72258  ORF Transcript_21828/g.72258 Transcript_21828/m.72258 type:complete len:317 (+) Transcript_21828:74-1024(+)
MEALLRMMTTGSMVAAARTVLDRATYEICFNAATLWGGLWEARGSASARHPIVTLAASGRAGAHEGAARCAHRLGCGAPRAGTSSSWPSVRTSSAGWATVARARLAWRPSARASRGAGRVGAPGGFGLWAWMCQRPFVSLPFCACSGCAPTCTSSGSACVPPWAAPPLRDDLARAFASTFGEFFVAHAAVSSSSASALPPLLPPLASASAAGAAVVSAPAAAAAVTSVAAASAASAARLCLCRRRRDLLPLPLLLLLLPPLLPLADHEHPLRRCPRPPFVVLEVNRAGPPGVPARLRASALVLNLPRPTESPLSVV